MTINDTAMPRARRPEALSSRPAAPGESGTRRSNNLNPTAPGFAPRSPPELLSPELLPLRRKLLRRKLLDARRPSPDRRNRAATPTVEHPRNLTGASTPRPPQAGRGPHPAAPRPASRRAPPRSFSRRSFSRSAGNFSAGNFSAGNFSAGNFSTPGGSPPDRRNRTATPTVPATLRELPRPDGRKQAATAPRPPRPPQSDSVSLAARRTASTASAA